MTEDDLQKTVVKWLLLQLSPGVVFHHSPNEGKRHVNFKVKLKAMGMRAGWPDLEFMIGGLAFFIEMKLIGKKLNDNQIETHRVLRAAGCPVATCHSLDEVIGTVRAWGLVGVSVA